MPIPGRMPTKDMCAWALASLRLSALPSCRAPLSPLGSRASRLWRAAVCGLVDDVHTPRHVADGHPARHVRGLDEQVVGTWRRRAACTEGAARAAGQSSKGPASWRAHRSPPRRLGDLRSAENTLSPSGPSRPRRDGDHRRRQAVGHPERQSRCPQGATRRREYTPRCSGSGAPQRRCTCFVIRQTIHERGNREYQGTRLDTRAHSA